MKKLKKWLKSKWQWFFAEREARIFQSISVKYFSLEQQIAFIKGARELMEMHPKCEITLRKSDCDMLLNIEASLLKK